MTSEATTTPVSAASADRHLPWLVLLFVASGCAALIYEIVWFQMLQLVIGASGISLGVLLGTFMGGMFLGSLLLPRFVARGGPGGCLAENAQVVFCNLVCAHVWHLDRCHRS